MRVTQRPARARKVHPACTVAGCALPLAPLERSVRCARGHAFDVARSGYVNLLQPGDRRSLAAGDARETVAARHALEERGLGASLRGALLEAARGAGVLPGEAVLDVGAGTGRLVHEVAHALDAEGWAVDLSAACAERGARGRPELGWVVANADRRLPFADGAFALVISCTGPKNAGEFRRVLAPGGSLLVAVPAPDDLIELRAALAGEGRPVDRVVSALEVFGDAFELADRSEARERARLGREELELVLATAYRGARHAERERLAAVDGLEVTLALEILRLVPRP